MLERHPEAGLCCCSRRSYLPDGSVAKVADPWRPSAEPAYLPPSEVRRIVERRGTFITGASTIYRRSSIEGHMPWRTEVGGFNDGLVGHTIALESGLCFIPKVLVSRRVSQTQLSRQGADDPEHVLGITDRAAHLMETEYGHLWPRSFVKEYRRMAARSCGRAIQQLLRERNDDILGRMEEVSARRPAALAGPYLATLRLAMRTAELAVGVYVILVYPPGFRRIRLRLARVLRRGG